MALVLLDHLLGFLRLVLVVCVLGLLVLLLASLLLLLHLPLGLSDGPRLLRSTRTEQQNKAQKNANDAVFPFHGVGFLGTKIANFSQNIRF